MPGFGKADRQWIAKDIQRRQLHRWQLSATDQLDLIGLNLGIAHGGDRSSFPEATLPLQTVQHNLKRLLIFIRGLTSN